MRIGSGFDAHRYSAEAAGDGIMLGCVKVPCRYGVIAHSDGDVIVHALCDALLGAAALGDIGRHFPDTDPAFRDASGAGLLAATWEKVRAAGHTLGNADITLIAEQPRVKDHIDAMCIAMAEVMKVDPSLISVKATTTEQMGYIGREEGLAALAVVLIL